MGEILEFAERAWQGAMAESAVHPGRVRLGLEELEDGLAFVSAFSNMAVLKTERGLCFFDTSGPFHARNTSLEPDCSRYRRRPKVGTP